METLFSVSAKFEDSVDGALHLCSHREGIYTLLYRSSSDSFACDLDEVEFCQELTSVSFREVPRRNQLTTAVIQIASTAEYEQLCEAARECNLICETYLHLLSVTRDCYFNGLYSAIDENFQSYVTDSIMCMNQPSLAGFQFPSFAKEIESILAFASTTETPSASLAKIRSASFVDIHCVFCDTAKSSSAELEFVEHPYVPVMFDGTRLYMCLPCMLNWKEFRDGAFSRNEAILPGEVNEEICGICSDSPDEVILCSTCPRSFCRTCLQRVLSGTMLSQLDAQPDADWNCMCCALGYPSHPSLAMADWKYFNNSEGKPEDVAQSILPIQPQPNQISTLAASSPTSIPHNGVPLQATKLESDSSSSLSGKSSRSAVASSRPKRSQSDSQKGNSNDEMKPSLKNRPSSASHATTSSVDAADSHSLPPVNKQEDELFYFSQYVQFLDNQREIETRDAKSRFLTEDFCFLCKDGGNLVECDYRKRVKSSSVLSSSSQRVTNRCRKVYHSYCLDYQVPEKGEWMCPRHFCDCCGSQDIQFICRYCPITICKKCPSEFGKKFNQARYVEVGDIVQSELCGLKGCQVIICNNCLEVIGKCIKRGDLPQDFPIPENSKRFCGPLRRGSGKESIFVQGNASTCTEALVSSNTSSTLATRSSKSESLKTVESTRTTSSSFRNSGATRALKRQRTHLEAENSPQLPSPANQLNKLSGKSMVREVAAMETNPTVNSVGDCEFSSSPQNSNNNVPNLLCSPQSIPSALPSRVVAESPPPPPPSEQPSAVVRPATPPPPPSPPPLSTSGQLSPAVASSSEVASPNSRPARRHPGGRTLQPLPQKGPPKAGDEPQSSVSLKNSVNLAGMRSWFGSR